MRTNPTTQCDKKKKFESVSDEEPNPNQVGQIGSWSWYPIRLENVKKSKHTQTQINDFKLDYMFRLNSSYIFPNSINPKPDWVDLKSIRTRICPFLFTNTN